MPDLLKTLALTLAGAGSSALAEGVLVLETDFGTKDGAVAAMKGVAVGVSPRLVIDERSHENRRKTITSVFDRTRCHDPRNGAGERREHRNEGTTMESDLTHHSVHQKCGAGHVSGVF